MKNETNTPWVFTFNSTEVRDMETMVWLGIMIVAILIEIATMGLTTIWFAGGALIAVLASAIHLPLAVQIIAFLLVSVLLLVFTRPSRPLFLRKNNLSPTLLLPDKASFAAL